MTLRTPAPTNDFPVRVKALLGGKEDIMYPENRISQGAKRSRENLDDTARAYGLEAIAYRAGIRQTNETGVIEAMMEIGRAVP